MDIIRVVPSPSTSRMILGIIIIAVEIQPALLARQDFPTKTDPTNCDTGEYPCQKHLRNRAENLPAIIAVHNKKTKSHIYNFLI